MVLALARNTCAIVKQGNLLLSELQDLPVTNVLLIGITEGDRFAIDRGQVAVGYLNETPKAHIGDKPKAAQRGLGARGKCIQETVVNMARSRIPTCGSDGVPSALACSRYVIERWKWNCSVSGASIRANGKARANILLPRWSRGSAAVSTFS